ncbi:hypothetical protein OMR07_16675 [Methylobacterium organophilum]|nr:hypothetical protein [Methylobacterium organophilum]
MRGDERRDAPALTRERAVAALAAQVRREALVMAYADGSRCWAPTSPSASRWSCS